MDVLIIDDDRGVAEAFAKLLAGDGYSCAIETDARAGARRAGEARAVLLDLHLPGVWDLELLTEILSNHPRTPVIMVTAYATVKVAVEAMKLGATDFITKPPSADELTTAVRKALDAQEEQSEETFDATPEIIFRDPASAEIIEKLRRIAKTELSILLEAETGVGKEVMARLIWQWSGRSERPFVKICCTAIPPSLFESELFGHRKGAFTGAVVDKPGRVELADGGTLFLDEIGELPPEAQAKLLQFLQDKTFEPVGGLRTLSADVRIIAATNRDLDADVAEGSFRSDILYRLGIRLRIPPLRERPGDVPALAEYFLAKFSARAGTKLAFAPGAIDALTSYPWPGNVRELETAVERAVALARGTAIDAEDLLPRVEERKSGGLRTQRETFERERIVAALEATRGNRTRAADALGLSRRMLQKKLKKYGIE